MCARTCSEVGLDGAESATARRPCAVSGWASRHRTCRVLFGQVCIAGDRRLVKYPNPRHQHDRRIVEASEETIKHFSGRFERTGSASQLARSSSHLSEATWSMAACLVLLRDAGARAHGRRRVFCATPPCSWPASRCSLCASGTTSR